MKITLAFALTLFGLAVQAQEKPDFSWISGTWRGPGFGGTFEEIWSQPDAMGTVMGMFRFHDDQDSIQFYEFWKLDGSGLLLKHFTPEFIGWEEKDGFVNFPMVSAETGKITLKGLVYELIDEKTLRISLDMKNKGEVKTHVFTLTRSE